MDTLEKSEVYRPNSHDLIPRDNTHNTDASIPTQDGDPEKGTSTPSTSTASADEPHAPPPADTTASLLRGLSFLDRFLVLWILLAMALGLILGNFVPSTGPRLQQSTFVGVSVPIAVGLLVMMYPILCKVRYETLHLLFKHREIWVQIGVSFVINWILAPLLMTGLAWAFLPDRKDLREGLIFVGYVGEEWLEIGGKTIGLTLLMQNREVHSDGTDLD